MTDGITDLSWYKYLYSAKVHERFRHRTFDVVGIEVQDFPGSADPFVFRMFFFTSLPEELAHIRDHESTRITHVPRIAINLETTLPGGWAITEQRGSLHRVAARLEHPLSYKEFRDAALGLVTHEDA